MSQVPSLAAVADPSPRYVDGPAVDYFVIEMVNTLRASSAVATARAKKVEQEMIDAGLMPTPAPALPALKKDKIRESMGSNASRSSISKDGQEGEEEELRARLEAIGMHVGANMAERFVSFASLLQAYVELYLDYAMIAVSLQTRSMLSSSYAKTSGAHVGRSRLTTYAPITEWVAVSSYLDIIVSL